MNKGKGRKILFYNPFSAWPFHLETDLELVKKHLDVGDEVIFLTCNRDLEVCEPNHTHNYLDCHACITRRKHGFRLLGLTDKVEFKSFKDLTDEQSKIIEQYQGLEMKTIDDLKAVTFEQCDIGMAVAASLIDRFREAEPAIADQKEYINNLMRVALTVYFSMKNNINKFKPDELYLFNGRYAALRPALRAAQELNINVKVHERSGVMGKYTITQGTYPHDFEKKKQSITETWENSTLGLEEKIKIGSKWYEDCRQYGLSKAGLTYKVKQEDTLPVNFDTNKFNVVIYSSSEEEYAAISGYLSRIYNNQNDGVQRIVEGLRFLPNVHIYLRVHPNLKGVNNSQTRFIESIKNTYPNLTVIDAASTISSYKLMDSANVVIVFASTMGLEAAYAGRKCLLVRRTQWEDLGACTRINSHEEVVEAIKDMIANPSQKIDWEARKLGAIKFGFYNNTYGIPFQYFKHETRNRLTYNNSIISPDFLFIRRVFSRLYSNYRNFVSVFKSKNK